MKNLKEKNKLQQAMLMGAPLLIIFLLQMGLEQTKATIDYFVASTGLVTVLSAVLVLFSDIIPQSLKHKLVFLRFKNELPGHRCDKICFADPRLSRDELMTKWRHVFGSEVSKSERNGLWYRNIYSPVKDEPQVQSAHQKFLLYRDATAGSFIILLSLTLWSISEETLPHLGDIHPWATLIQGFFVLVTLLSAQANGKRMVMNATVVKTL